MHKKDMNHWLEIKQLLPAHVQLVAVSKYHSIEQIAEAYTAGCRDFGESRVQELRAKQEALPKDIRWHFIGHLQTNKVRDLLRLKPYLIQSVDSERLLTAIDAEAGKQGLIQNILLEIHAFAELWVWLQTPMRKQRYADALPNCTALPKI